MQHDVRNTACAPAFEHRTGGQRKPLIAKSYSAPRRGGRDLAAQIEARMCARILLNMVETGECALPEDEIRELRARLGQAHAPAARLVRSAGR